MANQNKRGAGKEDFDEIWRDTDWVVKSGRLIRPRGHPGKVDPLFRLIAEKLPFESLGDVAADLKEYGVDPNGIYIAHDSMGCPRYIGRGHVIHRLRARKRAASYELVYYSFYLVKNKIHEREIETLLIRAAGPLLHFNDRKKRVDISPGSVRDFEPGTEYYRRRPNGWGTTYDTD